MYNANVEFLDSCASISKDNNECRENRRGTVMSHLTLSPSQKAGVAENWATGQLIKSVTEVTER